MTGDEADKLGFREWTAHYEKEQEADRDKINTVVDGLGNLSGEVRALTANMNTLMDNQKGMFNRMNRPWQWGVVVAAFIAMFSMAAMFGTMASLIVGPIHDNLVHLESVHARDVERNLALHMWFRDSLNVLEQDAAESKKDREWLSKMEERMNLRLHK